MFNAAMFGGIAREAKLKQDLKAAQAIKPEAREFIIQWNGSPWDGLRATFHSAIPGEAILILASGRKVSVPTQNLVAAPKAPAKEKEKDKKDEKKKDEETEKSKKVVPEDKPDTRGGGAQEEDVTKRAKEASTEIEKPPVLEQMKKGPKAIPVETARTAPEAGEGLKILVAAAKAANAATAEAAAFAKEAQALLGKAKVEETKKVQAVIDDMEKTNVIVAKIEEELVGLDAEKNVAAVNIPKSGALRARYDQAKSLLESIQLQAKEQAKVIKGIEAEAEEQYGATYNVQKRVSLFPASMQAALKAVAGFAEFIKGVIDWVKSTLGLAEDAEKAVAGLGEELKSAAKGGEAKASLSVAAIKVGDKVASSTPDGSKLGAGEVTELSSDKENTLIDGEAAFVAFPGGEMLWEPISALTPAAEGLSPAEAGEIGAFVDANAQDAIEHLKAVQTEEVSGGKTWSMEDAYEVLFDFLADRWVAVHGAGVNDEGPDDAYFAAFDEALDEIMQRAKAEGIGFETAKFPPASIVKARLLAMIAEAPLVVKAGDDVKPTVDLIGKDGNAFMILGLCNRAAKKAGWSPEKLKEFQDKAMSGDYNHLLQTVMEYFEVEGEDVEAAKATSEGASDFISQEIGHLIKDKGYEPSRAKGAAYNIARRKGYKVGKKKTAAALVRAEDVKGEEGYCPTCESTDMETGDIALDNEGMYARRKFKCRNCGAEGNEVFKVEYETTEVDKKGTPPADVEGSKRWSLKYVASRVVKAGEIPDLEVGDRAIWDATGEEMVVKKIQSGYVYFVPEGNPGNPMMSFTIADAKDQFDRVPIRADWARMGGTTAPSPKIGQIVKLWDDEKKKYRPGGEDEKITEILRELADGSWLVLLSESDEHEIPIKRVGNGWGIDSGGIGAGLKPKGDRAEMADEDLHEAAQSMSQAERKARDARMNVKHDHEKAASDASSAADKAREGAEAADAAAYRLDGSFAAFQASIKRRTGLTAADAGVADEAAFKAKVAAGGADAWIAGFIQTHGLHDLAPRAVYGGKFGQERA